MIEEKLEELEAPLNHFVHLWHPFVAFLIMPAFALANAGVVIVGMWVSALATPVAIGAGLGLSSESSWAFSDRRSWRSASVFRRGQAMQRRGSCTAYRCWPASGSPSRSS